MAEFRKSAVKIMQGKRALFLTYLTVRDFMTDGFYRVDHLDVQGNTGMQRLLNGARARSFGNDIIGADEHNEAFLPTSVFLATSGNIGYDEDAKELFFDAAPHAGVCPLDVVDGQHRIEGLKYAVGKDPRLLDFPVSAVIAPNMDKPEKMLQFVVVNTKQRPVDAGVAQHITARFFNMTEVENLPYLPSWLKKQVEKGDDDVALTIARAFNSDENSPWYGRIQFADERKNRRHTINQATFVKSVKRVILTRNHPYHNLHESKRLDIMRNYWRAVAEICIASSADGDSGAQSVVLKYTGLQFFLFIFSPVIHQLAKNKKYTVQAIKDCLLSTREHLPPSAVRALSPEFWERGSDVSGMNSAATAAMAKDFAHALAELAEAGDDEIQV